MSLIIHPKSVDSKYTRWRGMAIKYYQFDAEEYKRLEWMIMLDQGYSVLEVISTLGGTKSVVYEWRRRFDPDNLNSLKNKSSRPHNTRIEKIDPLVCQQVTDLRTKYPVCGKKKIQEMYKNLYKEHVSTHRIQQIINKDPKLKIAKRKPQKASKKKSVQRITQLSEDISFFGQLIHFDTVEIRKYGVTRYVYTGVDELTRMGFAYVYDTHTAANAADFLRKMIEVFQCPVKHIHTDNGSEFAGEFAQLVKDLQCTHWYSRVRVSKDNGKCERFNRTIQEEFIDLGNFEKDLSTFNAKLLDFIIFYNSFRPHHSLSLQSPLSFLSGTYSANTTSCSLFSSMI